MPAHEAICHDGVVPLLQDDMPIPTSPSASQSGICNNARRDSINCMPFSEKVFPGKARTAKGGTCFSLWPVTHGPFRSVSHEWYWLCLRRAAVMESSFSILVERTLARRISSHQNTHRLTNCPAVPGTEGFPEMLDFQHLKQTGMSWSPYLCTHHRPHQVNSSWSCVSIWPCFHFYFCGRHPPDGPDDPHLLVFTPLLVTCHWVWTGHSPSLLMTIGQK